MRFRLGLESLGSPPLMFLAKGGPHRCVFGRAVFGDAEQSSAVGFRKCDLERPSAEGAFELVGSHDVACGSEPANQLWREPRFQLSACQEHGKALSRSHVTETWSTASNEAHRAT